MKTTMIVLLALIATSTLFAQEKHIVIENEQGAFKSRKIEDNIKITYYTVAFANCGDKILYEGKVYGTVLIGSQCWFKENLNVGVYQIGTNNQTNNGGTNIIEKYCYDNNPANCDLYGGLYQWDEAMKYSTTEGAQGICPNGWHIPTRTEQTTLSSANDGTKLKAIGEGDGTNTSGFSALLSGKREEADGSFTRVSSNTYFWASQVTGNNAYNLSLSSSSSTPSYNSAKNYGFSVRCLKN